MRRTLELAVLGTTSPNPMVGAIIVRRGKVVGTGYHTRAGAPHAEVEALKQAGHKAKSADLYVNLEPCCHFGRTPPCIDAIIQAGIKRVFVGMRDPNPKVSGKGLRALKAKGIAVVSGILDQECQKLNESFVKIMKTGQPFVIIKSALSLDGKIATRSGDSQWISGEMARNHVHKIRSQVDAIMVGTETVLKDNPRLTCRLKTGLVKHPTRIILDRRNRVPLTANVFKNSRSQKVVYVTGLNLPAARHKTLLAKKVDVLQVKAGAKGFNIKSLLKELANKDINSILVEGGAELNASIVKAGGADRIITFISPILIGGVKAPGLLGGSGVMKVAGAMKLENMEVTKMGEDLMVEATICSAE
ncbi:MAG: bifunctional diaminohydroxyphosphoribosylaminopyrimidine deaminase/5-amino-6-(5-phosphoribosylamino)uracil reductase RibD [Nitrospinaceae bacterium]|nr:bifunctional diaminohydroxyphosphoribosylaminopyrimidine deaminase/5-amino-6-(5-phosphoribosylamino)uracil reductase RibD [Nitrospinaceae bacterium]